MLRIGNLNISLPQGFGPRADTISRLVAQELRQLKAGRDRVIDTIHAPDVEVDARWSDRHIAASIATSIRSRIPESS